jgi:hypothetical protein
MAMTLVSTTTVGSGTTASITFSNVPQTATDLVILLSARGDSTNLTFSFNGNSSFYQSRRIRGTGAAASQVNRSDTTFGDLVVNTTDTASTFSNVRFYVANYKSTTLRKAWAVDGVTESNTSLAYQLLYSGLWSDTIAAITSVTIGAGGTTFSQYTTASLYLIS